MKNIKINEKYEDADNYNKKMQTISKDTTWYESKTKYDNYYKAKNQQTKTAQEVEAARKELTIARRARLQELYGGEAQQYNEELAAKGLRIMKDRE